MSTKTIDAFDFPEGSEKNRFFTCCAKNCKSTTMDSKLFPFPEDETQARHWLQICNREDLEQYLKEWKVIPFNFMLCSKHFKDNCFNNKTSLAGDALPESYTENELIAVEIIKTEEIKVEDTNITNEIISGNYCTHILNEHFFKYFT